MCANPPPGPPSPFAPALLNEIRRLLLSFKCTPLRGTPFPPSIEKKQNHPPRDPFFPLAFFFRFCFSSLFSFSYSVEFGMETLLPLQKNDEPFEQLSLGLLPVTYVSKRITPPSAFGF